MLYEHAEVRRQQAREHAEALARAYRQRRPGHEEHEAEARPARIAGAVERLTHPRRPRVQRAPAPPA
jgi:hypothetical protein